jgi:hypothetical protein
VRTNSTILVLHSGNHEIIGVRHRQSQTLYISNVIEPHAATPAYGKIHVGLYIAALWDVMDRIQQDLQTEEENSKNGPSNPPPDGGGEGEDKDEDEDEDEDEDDDHRRKKRPRTDQRGHRSRFTTRGKCPGKSGVRSGGRTAGGMTDQVRDGFLILTEKKSHHISRMFYLRLRVETVFCFICVMEYIYLLAQPPLYARGQNKKRPASRWKTSVTAITRRVSRSNRWTSSFTRS